MYQQILKFWFEEIDPAMWWRTDEAFDAEIRARYAEILQSAMQAELYPWRICPAGRLAEVIVLDQFSRNLYRNTPQAFSQDAMALALAQEAIAVDAHRQLTPIQRNFLYMPFMHSESRQIHSWAEQLFRDNGLEENYKFELSHKAIIDRFGRYPHRNAILNRRSSAEELKFLQQPGSRF